MHSIRRARARAIPRGDQGLEIRVPAALLGLLLALGWLLLASSARASGAIYTYTDDRGVTHFTNIRKGDSRFQEVSLRPARRVGRAPEIRDYDLLIHATALEADVPPALVKAVIAAESAFDPEAVSHKGAQGLMQLMPRTADMLGVENAFEPKENVRGGASYLRAMLDRYGDLSRAVAAYNAGPAAVDRYNGIPPYRETRDYVDRVLTYYRHYYGDFAR
ncbi:MAG: lytic transglycosylase domain-containing protein [Myxococcota bacterium]